MPGALEGSGHRRVELGKAPWSGCAFIARAIIDEPQQTGTLSGRQPTIGYYLSLAAGLVGFACIAIAVVGTRRELSGGDGLSALSGAGVPGLVIALAVAFMHVWPSPRNSLPRTKPSFKGCCAFSWLSRYSPRSSRVGSCSVALLLPPICGASLSSPTCCKSAPRYGSCDTLVSERHYR